MRSSVDESDEELASIHDMLFEVIRSLVDRPQDVCVKIHLQDGSVTFQVEADPSDRGKLIGRGGKTARALRVILNANAAKIGRRLRLDILAAGESSQAQDESLDDI